MTGNALMDFIIAIVVLGGAVALFFAAIEGISKNALFTKIAKIAIGVSALVAFLFALKAVLFGGGGLAISPVGILYFAIGIIVVLVVLYIVELFLSWLLDEAQAKAWKEPIMFVIGAVCLIALLWLAANVLFGVGPGLPIGGNIAPTRSIIR